MKDNTIDRQEQIDRYLLGEMEPDEQATFEKQLAAAPSLREEVELSRHIIRAFEQKGEQPAFEAMQAMPEKDFRTLLGSLREPKKKKNKAVRLIRLSAAVAAIALLLLYIGTRPRYSSEELYTGYYLTQPYEAFPSRGGDELTIEEKLRIREAKNLYEQKEYAEALAVYNQLIADRADLKSVPEEVLFHAAICQLETGDTSGAIEKLTHLSTIDYSDFQEAALWNLSLAYLKTNQRRQAESCLQQLIDKDGDYAGKARELKEKSDKKLWF